MKCRKLGRKIVWAVAVTALGVPMGVESLSFSITDLGTLGGGYSSAYAINNFGQVTGVSQAADHFEEHAFLYDSSTMLDLGTLGHIGSYGFDINDSGHVTGYSLTSPFTPPTAILYDGTPMRSIGSLEGAPGRSYGWGINNAGHIAGRSSTPSGDRAFYYDGSTMQNLGTLGGTNSSAYAINDLAQIVGSSDTSNGDRRAFLYDGGGMVDLGTLGGTDSSAGDINNVGVVTGTSDTLSGATHAFLYDEGTMTDLGTLGGYVFNSSINVFSQVVGTSRLSDSSSKTHAFYYDTSLDSMVDLNNLIDPVSGWELLDAADINDLGQIVGTGIINGETRAFLLTPEADAPIPEPATLSLLGMGLATLAVRSRRRAAQG